MITRKQKLLFVEKYHMPASVTGCRYQQEVVIERNRILAIDNLFQQESGCTVRSMHCSLCSKPSSKRLMRSDVIFVGEQHSCNSTHLGDSFDELRSKPRRVNHYIAFRSLY